jgi:hypothetical protein
MKKSQKNSSSNKRRTNVNDDYNLIDLGIDPPKIYRDNQRSSVKQSSTRKVSSTSKPSKKNENLTRAEKRQKDNKKRKKRNTFRKILIWLVVCVAIISVGTVLSLTVFFNIDTINVSGNEIYTADEVLERCTINKGENLFLADLDNAEETLEQNLPYIYNAEITRKLPYTINIKITEATPAYSILNDDKTYILLDDNFKVLENNAEKAQGILISKATISSADLGLTVTFEDENVGECLRKLADVVNKNNFDEITSIYSNNISDNYVVYDNRIEFKLGTCDDLEDKIYQGLTACNELNQSNPNAKGTMNINGGKSIYFTEE